MKAAGGAIAGSMGKLISGVNGLAKATEVATAEALAKAKGSSNNAAAVNGKGATQAGEAEAAEARAPEAAAEAELNWFSKLLGPQLACFGQARQKGDGLFASSPALLKGSKGPSPNKTGDGGGGGGGGGGAASDALTTYRSQLRGAGACYLTFTPASVRCGGAARASNSAHTHTHTHTHRQSDAQTLWPRVQPCTPRPHHTQAHSPRPAARTLFHRRACLSLVAGRNLPRPLG